MFIKQYQSAEEEDFILWWDQVTSKTKGVAFVQVVGIQQ